MADNSETLSKMIADRLKKDTLLTSLFISFIIWKWQFLVSVIADPKNMDMARHYLNESKGWYHIAFSTFFYTFIWINVRGWIEKWIAKIHFHQESKILLLRNLGFVDIRQFNRLLDNFKWIEMQTSPELVGQVQSILVALQQDREFKFTRSEVGLFDRILLGLQAANGAKGSAIGALDSEPVRNHARIYFSSTDPNISPESTTQRIAQLRRRLAAWISPG